MSKELHVLFDGEILKPIGPVNLKPNTRYRVTVECEETSGKQDLWDVLNSLSGVVEGPVDWAQEHDHYLYGTPKRKKS